MCVCVCYNLINWQFPGGGCWLVSLYFSRSVTTTTRHCLKNRIGNPEFYFIISVYPIEPVMIGPKKRQIHFQIAIDFWHLFSLWLKISASAIKKERSSLCRLMEINWSTRGKRGEGGLLLQNYECDHLYSLASSFPNHYYYYHFHYKHNHHHQWL